MGVYQDWKSFLDGMAEGDAGYFQAEYYDKEALLYQKVLTDYPSPVEGRFDELAEQYHFELRMFAGFLEGVNTSLVNPIVLEKLRVNSRIRLEIDPKKLYFNMLEAKATWLYQLPEWEGILSETEQKEIVKERNQSRQAFREKIDRNAPCPCGSGKKYKKCHGKIA